MSLRDELLSNDNAASVFSRIRHSEHEDIDRQISEFIAMGGKIKYCAIGQTGNMEARPLIVNESNPNGKNEYNAIIEKGKKGAKANKDKFSDKKEPSKRKQSKYGMGIYCTGRYFTYWQSGVCYGVGQKLNHEQCLELRAVVRKRLGLPPAEY